jgi:ABC-type branched-subunit amino acid transport system substrate-binding protein
MRRLLAWSLGLCVVIPGSLVTVGAAARAAGSPAPIVVGGDGDLAIAAGVAQGFEAGIARFNKAGGLDGRKIEFLGVLDDGFSQQTNLNNAQKLVENDHVMAVAPMISEIAGSATGTFLAQSHTPFIGWAVNASFAAAPQWGFGIDGLQINPAIQALGSKKSILDAPAKEKIAFIAENVAGAVSANDALAAVAKIEGADVVYRDAPIPVLGTTSYAPYAQAIIASGANVAFEALDSADAIGLAAALKAAGFKGAIENGVTYYPGGLAGQPNEAAALNHVYVADLFPADENDTRAVKQAEKDLEAVGQAPDLTSGVSVGYWSAIVFEQMLRATLTHVGGDAAKVTGSTLERTVNGGFTYKDPIAGGIGTEHFPAAEKVPTGCSTLLQVDATTYRQVTPYGCYGAIDSVTKKRVDEKTGADK